MFPTTEGMTCHLKRSFIVYLLVGLQYLKLEVWNFFEHYGSLVLWINNYLFIQLWYKQTQKWPNAMKSCSGSSSLPEPLRIFFFQELKRKSWQILQTLPMIQSTMTISGSSMWLTCSWVSYKFIFNGYDLESRFLSFWYIHFLVNTYILQ